MHLSLPVSIPHLIKSGYHVLTSEAGKEHYPCQGATVLGIMPDSFPSSHHELDVIPFAIPSTCDHHPLGTRIITIVFLLGYIN